MAEYFWPPGAAGRNPALEGADVTSPKSLTVKTPRPNPVTSAVGFRYEFDGTYEGPGKLTVYDIAGRRIDEVLFDCAGSGGTVEWDAVSAAAPSGVYIARVEAAGAEAVVKFVVAR